MKISHARAQHVIDAIDSFHRGTDNSPLGFDMSLWYAESSVDASLPEPKRYAPECRTTACLAGWTVTLLDSAEHAHSLTKMQTTIYGGIGEIFMETAADLFEADLEARELLRELFCKLSYTWDDVKDELYWILDRCSDTGAQVVPS